jgi:hypothetical protein
VPGNHTASEATGQSQPDETHRLVASDEVTDAVEFLPWNGGINAQNLCIDGGVLVG